MKKVGVVVCRNVKSFMSKWVNFLICVIKFLKRICVTSHGVRCVSFRQDDSVSTCRVSSKSVECRAQTPCLVSSLSLDTFTVLNPPQSSYRPKEYSLSSSDRAFACPTLVYSDLFLVERPPTHTRLYQSITTPTSEWLRSHLSGVVGEQLLEP